MMRNDRTYYCVLVLGLLLCVGLYAEETVHFLLYGWNDPDANPLFRDVSNCQRVPESSTDIECPVKGYGSLRYRYKDLNYPDPEHKIRNNMVVIDRIQ
jgi:hypothetical protein